MNSSVLLTGLILCGGKSSRLGFDKLSVIKDTVPVYNWWLRVLEKHCSNIYISCNSQQANQYMLPNTLIDIESHQGPLGGIYSAILKHPDQALLVVACDLVYITKTDIDALIHNRDPSKYSTAFEPSDSNFPFPLCTIYEPKIFNDLIQEYQSSKRSALTILKKNEIKLIKHNINTNGINTPEEFDKWQRDLNSANNNMI
ncbi:MAG: NTP transferase domain-containing protein [Saprospiraceae bacterium]|uniref:NTP transferase domain-containing protein n=1 Tax=Candidatus Defluviibacterium haderslevense TaxID=2981993 RepID=A0A9D7XHP4_9BACT|nr:NTP transferase domain-containing protein [Candidatus Defluviibacterium haderslevense]